MSQLTDSVQIRTSPDAIQELLENLERHPGLNPDGFKYYRYTSRKTRGEGANAAVLVSLLGFWLPADLQVVESVPRRVILRTSTRQVVVEMRFTLEGNEKSTQVWLDINYIRQRLPPWRVRTRIKQWLRLREDVATLCGRFLNALKHSLEPTDPSNDELATPGQKQGPEGRSRFPLPVYPNQEHWDV